jgi:hypothetical protein
MFYIYSVYISSLRGLHKVLLLNIFVTVKRASVTKKESVNRDNFKMDAAG